MGKLEQERSKQLRAWNDRIKSQRIRYRLTEMIGATIEKNPTQVDIWLKVGQRAVGGPSHFWTDYRDEISFGCKGFPSDVLEFMNQNHQEVIKILQRARARARWLASDREIDVWQWCYDVLRQND